MGAFRKKGSKTWVSPLRLSISRIFDNFKLWEAILSEPLGLKWTKGYQWKVYTHFFHLRANSTLHDHWFGHKQLRKSRTSVHVVMSLWIQIFSFLQKWTHVETTVNYSALNWRLSCKHTHINVYVCGWLLLLVVHSADNLTIKLPLSYFTKIPV